MDIDNLETDTMQLQVKMESIARAYATIRDPVAQLSLVLAASNR